MYIVFYVFSTISGEIKMNTLWDRDERITIWGQKVKGQGHFWFETLLILI